MYNIIEVMEMATTTSKIKMLLSYYGRKQSDLIDCLGMSSKQSLGNKMKRDSWSARDLATVAEFLGCKIAFILPDGTTIPLDAPEKAPEGEWGREEPIK